MRAAANSTRTGRLPDSFDMLLGSHIHLAQVNTFPEDTYPPQIVIGNSGTQFVAPVTPPDNIDGVEIVQTEVIIECIQLARQ